ncbi:MlaD family protein [Patulibacter minatonensis]|uniref:MlaD family protein n=1 Tax=Patulibacter minatonensis TaxID=298163 RepID=UPI0004B49F45|nr:MlaD family protein [Patulibacter minatonensis]
MSPRTVRTPGRRAAGRRRGRGSTLLIGGIAIVILAVASAIGYRAAETVPGRQYYNLKAEFTQADNLSNHYEVRIGGLRAGQILKPRVKDGKALVDIRIDKKFGPLKSDSKLQVRLRSAVGVRYLEIIPGTKGTDLPDGGLLKTTNQTPNVALDQVLGTLDPTTRTKAQTFLNELGEGADGNGDSINLALRKLTPLLKDVQTLAKPLNDRAGITARFIRNTAGGVGAFDGASKDIAALAEPAQKALKPFGDTGIKETLQETPATMNQLRNQLPQIDRLVAAVDGLARDGRPALQQAPAALRETTRLAKGARPALRQAKTTLNLAKGAVDPTVSLLQTVQPQLPRINKPIDDVRPILNRLAQHACAIPATFNGWSEWLKYRDGASNTVRFTVTENPLDLIAGASNDGVPRTGGASSIPYPGPCVDGHGEAGPAGARVAESAAGLTYSPTFPFVR